MKHKLSLVVLLVLLSYLFLFVGCNNTPLQKNKSPILKLSAKVVLWGTPSYYFDVYDVDNNPCCAYIGKVKNIGAGTAIDLEVWIILKNSAGLEVSRKRAVLQNINPLYPEEIRNWSQVWLKSTGICDELATVNTEFRITWNEE